MGLRRLNPLRVIRNQRGVALLIALFAFSLLSFIAVEVAYDTTVEQIVSSQQVNRIRAYYAAKAGVQISLMRIMLYKQALAAFGDQLGNQKNMLDPIWSFPFMWPPDLGAGAGNISEVDKSQIQAATKESVMEGQYATTITPEGGRLDINDLGSEVETLKKAMIQQVVKFFESEVEHNEEFSNKYRGYNFLELANNIADYIDEDSESLNGGDEQGPYRDVEIDDLTLPPNRPLRTVDELMQVAGMTDDFYKVLAPRITVFGTKGININYADKDLLMSLDPTMTEEAVEKVIERRNDPALGGPFANEDEFLGFIQPYGVDTRALKEMKMPLLFDVEFNFRIVSTGVAGNVRREITAITYDLDNLKTRMAKYLDDQAAARTGTPASPTTSTNSTNANNSGNAGNSGNTGDPAKSPGIKAGKGRPTVVYWEEN